MWFVETAEPTQQYLLTAFAFDLYRRAQSTHKTNLIIRDTNPLTKSSIECIVYEQENDDMVDFAEF